jgi:hypothetical protein
VIRRFNRDQALSWTLWAACALAAIGAVVVLAAPGRGENRIAVMAFPFAVGTAALAANALIPNRNPWLGGLLYALAGLGVAYGIAVGVSLPLRLAVEGSCRPAPAPCPLGFDRPMTGGESFGLEAAVACGFVALVLSFVAIELQYRPRLRLFGPPPNSSAGHPGA